MDSIEMTPLHFNVFTPAGRRLFSVSLTCGIVIVTAAFFLPIGVAAAAGEPKPAPEDAASDVKNTGGNDAANRKQKTHSERDSSESVVDDVLSEILTLPAPAPVPSMAPVLPQAASPPSPAPPLVVKPKPADLLPPAPAQSRTSPPRARGRLGIRAGYMIPIAAERDFESNAVLGVYYRNIFQSRGRFSNEIGLDLLQSDSKDNNASSQVFAVRFEWLYALRNAHRFKPYVLSGAEVLMETTDEAAVNEEFTNIVGAVNIGVGMSLADGRIELRVTHSVLLGADNVKGLSLLSFAFGF